MIKLAARAAYGFRDPTTNGYAAKPADADAHRTVSVFEQGLTTI